jgi:hypothetical protein
VYVRSVGEKELNFQVSGMLWQRSLVMQDVETETLWSHLLGKGMRGELEGTELERIPSVITTWEDWNARYPESSVLAMKRTTGGYDEGQWEKARRFVFGISGKEKGESPAVGLRKLQREGVVMVKTDSASYVFTHRSKGGSVQAFRAELNGRPLVFSAGEDGYMKEEGTGARWSRETGVAISGPDRGSKLEPVAGTLSFVQAWEAFYPKSEIIQ